MISYVLDNPVDVSNVKPSLRGPYSAAFPEAIEQKQLINKLLIMHKAYTTKISNQDYR